MTTITSSNAFVSQPVPDILYILVDDEVTFEAIRAPEIESFMGERRCRAKAGIWNGIDVIFQFWLKEEEEEDDDDEPPLNEGVLRVVGNISVDDDPPWWWDQYYDTDYEAEMDLGGEDE